jgi:hypothetical protein
MALAVRARYKPDAFRSSLESLVANLDATVTPPTATLALPVQVVVYDDTVVTAATYRPGDPAVEQYITVVIEETLSVALEGFAALTAAEATADFAARLDAWVLTVKPALPLLAKALYAARRLPPRAVP